MHMSLSQQQALQLKLAITPTLRQSLDILSYGMQDLLSFIQEQAETNPLLEIDQSRLEANSLEMASMRNEGGSQAETYEQASSSQTMEQFLLDQLALANTNSDKERHVLLYFIRHLNDHGYLLCELDEVAETFELTSEEVLAALQLLQSFEPAGIGARSLAECLYLQLRDEQDVPAYAAEIIEHHLEEIADRQFTPLATQFGCSEAHIERVLQFIQTLNPRPVFDVHSGPTEYILPDLLLDIVDGVGVLQVNDQFLPDLSISTAYDYLMKENEEVAQFMKAKMSEILLLKKGIEQRHVTLYKVAQAILQAQPHFLTKGPEGLQPLRLKEIAVQTDFHISTISRTINQKYMQTPYGLLPLKHFFVRGLLNEHGLNQNIQLIQTHLKHLIEHENKQKPYSDQQLAQALADEGVTIARRTVAKYREQLSIPTSTKRRQLYLKKLNGGKEHD